MSIQRYLNGAATGAIGPKEAYKAICLEVNPATIFPWLTGTVDRARQAVMEGDWRALDAIVSCLADVHPVASYAVYRRTLLACANNIHMNMVTSAFNPVKIV